MFSFSSPQLPSNLTQFLYYFFLGLSVSVLVRKVILGYSSSFALTITSEEAKLRFRRLSKGIIT